MRPITFFILIVIITIVQFNGHSDALLKKKFILKKIIKAGVIAKLLKGKTKVIVPLIIPFHVSKFQGFGAFKSGHMSSGGWSSAPSYRPAPFSMHSMPSAQFSMSMSHAANNYAPPSSSSSSSSGWDSWSGNMIPDSSDSWNSYDQGSYQEQTPAAAPYGMPMLPANEPEPSYSMPMATPPSSYLSQTGWSGSNDESQQQISNDYDNADYSSANSYPEDSNSEKGAYATIQIETRHPTKNK